MPQAKKKKSTKTAKKPVVKTSRRKAVSRTKCKGVEPREKWHVYIVTSLSIIAGILLVADAAMIAVA